MAELVIKVQGPAPSSSGGGRAGTSSPGNSADIRKATADLKAQAQALKDLGTSFAAMQSTALKGFTVLAQGVSATQKGVISLSTQAKTALPAVGTAATNAGNAAAGAARATAYAWQRNLSGVVSSARQTFSAVAGAAGGVANAFRQAGQDASAAFSAALSGALLSGTLFRAGGQLAAGALRFGSSMGSSIVEGIGGALAGATGLLGSAIGTIAGGPAGGLLGGLIGNLAGGIPKAIGDALGAGLHVVGDIAAAAATFAGDLAGFIGDKVGTALKVGLVAAVGASIVGIGKAARFESVLPAFGELAKAAGVTATGGLQALRREVSGTINDVDLMTSANRAAALGVTSSLTEFGKLANVARLLGQTMGIDASQALERFILGLGRLSPRILDDLGLTIKLEDVYTDYGKSIGKAADALTAQEQRTALLNAVMAQATPRIAALAGANDTLQNSLDRSGASFSNILTKIGLLESSAVKALSSGLGPLFDGISQFLDRAARFPGFGFGDLGKTFTEGAAAVGDFLSKANFQDVFELAKTAAGGLWENIVGGAKVAFAAVKEYAFAALADITEKLGALADQAGFLSPVLAGGLKGAGGLTGGLRASSAGAASERATAGNDLAAANVRLAGAIDLLITQVRGRAPTPAPGSVFTAPPATGTGSAQTTLTSTLPAPSTVATAGGGTAKESNAPKLTVPAGGATLETYHQIQDRLTEAFQAAVGTADGLYKITAGLSGAFAEASHNIPEAQKILDALWDAAAERHLQDRNAEFLKAAEDRVAAGKEEEDRLKSSLEKAKSDEDEVSRARKDLSEQQLRNAKDEAAAARQVKDQLERDQLDAMRSFSDALGSIASEVKSRASSLQSAAGGFEPDDGIPRKLKSAANRARRHANQARKHDLNQSLAGVGLTELSDNGGEVAKGILEAQAFKESDAALKMQVAQADFIVAQNEANARADSAFEAIATEFDGLAADLEEQGKALDDKESKALDAINAAKDAIKSQADRLRTLEDEYDSIKRALQAIK